MPEEQHEDQQGAAESPAGPRLPSWREMNWDISPEMEEVLFEL
jgi:hypothetical protein